MSGQPMNEVLMHALLGPALKGARQDSPSTADLIEIEVSTITSKQIVGLKRPAPTIVVSRESGEVDPDDARYRIVKLRVHADYLPSFEELVETIDPTSALMVERQHARHEGNELADPPFYIPSITATHRALLGRDMKPFRFVRLVEPTSKASRKSAN